MLKIKRLPTRTPYIYILHLLSFWFQNSSLRLEFTTLYIIIKFKQNNQELRSIITRIMLGPAKF
jgi:hypothetical protein